MKENIEEFLFRYRWPIVTFLTFNCALSFMIQSAFLGVAASFTGIAFTAYIMSRYKD